jgi:hypothetical protein
MDKEYFTVDQYKIIRQCILRDVAESNQRISGIIRNHFDFPDKFSLVYNDIMANFAGDRNNSELRAIYDDMNNSTRRYGPHNYFDIDTLYAYSKYLERIVSEFERGERVDHVSKKSRLFSDAIRSATTWLICNHDKAETGFYDQLHPIKPAYAFNKNGVRVFSIVSTPSPKQFEESERFDNAYYFVRKYLELAHPEYYLNKNKTNTTNSNQNTGNSVTTFRKTTAREPADELEEKVDKNGCEGQLSFKF